MSLFHKFILSAFVIGSLYNQGEATCARCQKIEAERAKEQAEHPQQYGYYDDHISMAEEQNSTNSTLMNTTKANTKSSNQTLSSNSSTSRTNKNQANAIGDFYIQENIYQDPNNSQKQTVEESIEETILIPQN
jgi:hypothetical protein